MRRIYSAVLGAALIGLAIVSVYGYWATPAVPTAAVVDDYKFTKVPCWFDADWTATISCGELLTPASSGAFRLPVVILHEDAKERRNDPVVYLQGGPGASAKLHKEGIKSWLSWMRYAGLARDIILIDTRGTGRSRPALVCAEYNQANQRLLRTNILLADELAQNFQVTAACFDAALAANKSLDYRNFSTLLSAQDVRALMAELDYAEWNILGVSYGTRLALEIARQEQHAPQPQKLRSMVLDSVYPAGFGGVQTWPQVLDEAMQQFFAGCTALPECFAALHDQQQSLQQQFIQAAMNLRSSPRELTLTRWDGEAPVTFLVNDHRFVSATFAAIYDPNDWPKIIAAINAVYNHRSELMEPLLEPFINNTMSSDFNSLTFTAVDCADNPVMAEQDYTEALLKYPLLQDYTRDQWRFQLCHKLPSEMPLVRAEPKLPSLLLAGALDPITPVAWARVVHQEWPNSQLRVSNNTAHSVLGSDGCLLQQLIHFFDSPGEPFDLCDSEGQGEG